MLARSGLGVAVSAALVSLGAGLAGCGERAGSFTIAHGHVRVEGAEVTISRSPGPDAHLAGGGSLRIGGESVVLSPEQRTQVDNYYQAALAVRTHAIETGKAGAAVGATAAEAVVNGLMRGDTSQIGQKIESKAEDVKRTALGICQDLQAMRSAQQALVTTLEPFRPYAVIEESDVSECGKDLHPQPAG